MVVPSWEGGLWVDLGCSGRRVIDAAGEGLEGSIENSRSPSLLTGLS